MPDLHKRIKKQFPDVDIVKLKDLTKKIAVVSKVRIGDEKKRDVFDYYEVTLSDINEYGIIIINTTKDKPAPANKRALSSQRLHKNDLLVSYRGIYIKVGRIDREYDIPVVSNNSVIRIEFNNDNDTDQEELSMFVQAYLQLPFIKEYIANRPQENTNDTKHKRKIIGPLFLSNIPIPKFNSKNHSFKNLLNNRLEILNNAKDMLVNIQQLIKELEIYKDEALSIQPSNKNPSDDIYTQDLQLLKAIKDARQMVKRVVVGKGV